MEKDNEQTLDSEWVQLIKEALEMGIAKEDIRKFLNGEGTRPPRYQQIKDISVS